MPRTALTVQKVPAFGGSIANLAFTAADAANNHEFVNDGRSVLVIKNDDAAPKTVDVIGVASSSTFNRTGDEQVVVPANQIGFAGPFPSQGFRQSDGTVHVDIAADTSLSFAVVSPTPTPL